MKMYNLCYICIYEHYFVGSMFSFIISKKTNQRNLIVKIIIISFKLFYVPTEIYHTNCFVQTGVWSSMPHLLMWVFAILTGWLSDYLISNGKLEILQQRRLFSTIGILIRLCYSQFRQLCLRVLLQQHLLFYIRRPLMKYQ